MFDLPTKTKPLDGSAAMAHLKKTLANKCSISNKSLAKMELQHFHGTLPGACILCYCTTLHLAAVGRHDDGQLGSIFAKDVEFQSQSSRPFQW
jgi:hypothetical protein